MDHGLTAFLPLLPQRRHALTALLHSTRLGTALQVWDAVVTTPPPPRKRILNYDPTQYDTYDNLRLGSKDPGVDHLTIGEATSDELGAKQRSHNLFTELMHLNTTDMDALGAHDHSARCTFSDHAEVHVSRRRSALPLHPLCPLTPFGNHAACFLHTSRVRKPCLHAARLSNTARSVPCARQHVACTGLAEFVLLHEGGRCRPSNPDTPTFQTALQPRAATIFRSQILGTGSCTPWCTSPHVSSAPSALHVPGAVLTSGQPCTLHPDR